jgi:enoyl-CoA hydratase
MDDGKANAMNPTLLGQLQGCLEQAKSAEAVVISGRSGFFSGGLDLKLLPSLPADEFQKAINLFERVMRTVLEFPVPVVSAVEGHSMAGGTVLMLCSDMVIATPGAYKIGLNETAIGLALPEFVWQLAKLRLHPRAYNRALMQGMTFPPEEAQALGFLDELRPLEYLYSVAEERARAAAKVPAEAYRKTKAMIQRELLAVPEGQLVQGISEAFRSLSLGQNLRK